MGDDEGARAELDGEALDAAAFEPAATEEEDEDDPDEACEDEPLVALEAVPPAACELERPGNDPAAMTEKMAVTAPAPASIQRVMVDTLAKPASRALVRESVMNPVSGRHLGGSLTEAWNSL
ncbi:MAG: hypothetical protein ACP5P1_00845 [Acidimicrobiales bacterium]